MTPLSRLVTVGPIAAFSKRYAVTPLAESRSWPRTRRLPSNEDTRVILAGNTNELDDWRV